jgi:signal transduction histidine kinase/CheY-like chemotaxis protein
MSSSNEPASHHTGSFRFQRLRSGVIALGVLILLAFAGSSASDAWRSYRNSLVATDREIGNVAQALAEQTAWTWQGVDLVLRDTARWYQNDGYKIPAERLDEVLASRTAGVRQVRLFTIVDAQGIQRHRSRGVSPPNLDVSDRSYFIAQRDGTAKVLFMSEPLVTRSEHREGVELSRRLEDGHGVFAGVVTGIVDLEDLKQFYGVVNLGVGSAIQLLRADGTLLVRNPPVAGAVGRQFPQLAAIPNAPATRLMSPVDGKREFIAVAPVRDTPLVLTVTREEDVALRPWRAEAIIFGTRALILTLLGGLTIAILLRQLRRLEAGERALRESEAQLRQSQKMEAMGTLAGGIAHDFNNILGAILGYGELALQQSAEGSAMRRYLDNIMHAAGRAKALVDRILGFSRSGLGERLPVNVQSLIEETLELLAGSLPMGIRLEIKLAAGNAAVIGDATHLHQVAMNLCTNALHAMERGGVLSVALERIELSRPRSLSRGNLPPGLYVRLVVSDTGSGIPPAVLERMFDPFFTTRGVGEGTGLGLSLVHGIVAELGGAIDVTTKAAEGTRFEVWLPIAGEVEKPGTEAFRELPRGNGETIMIVDDERPLVALAEELLAELGYEPVGFDSSSAALQAFRADPDRFDLILTDEAMPDLIGTELAREARRLRRTFPIILMSGHGGPQLAKRAAEIGVNELLRKPLQRRDLAESLARVLAAPLRIASEGLC